MPGVAVELVDTKRRQGRRHRQLGALRTEIKVIQAQLNGYDRRLDDIERDIRELQKEVHR